MYNEVRERKVKGAKGLAAREDEGRKIRWKKWKKKEGGQYLPRTGGIQMRSSSLLPRCLHGETFLQTTMAAGQPSFFSTFVGARVPRPFLH